MYSKKLSQIEALGNGLLATIAGTPAALNPTNHAVMVGNGTTFSSLTAGTTGQLLIGVTGGDPSFGSSIDADTNLTSSTSGATRTFLVDNTSNSNNASSVLQARTAGALAADPRVLLSVQGGNDWCLKNNNVGNRQFIIANNALGTSNQFFLIDTTGNVTHPSSANVIVYNNGGASNVTGDGTVYTLVLDTEIYDKNSNFASNTFTAPVTAAYQVNITVGLTNIGAGHTGSVMTVVTSNRTWQIFADSSAATRDSGNNLIITYSLQVDMDANDTLTVGVMVNGSTKTVGILGITSSQPRSYLSVSIA